MPPETTPAELPAVDSVPASSAEAVSETMPGVDRVAMAKGAYDHLAQVCRQFDPETVRLRRQWEQEIKDRLNARAKERIRLVAQKGVAYRYWQALAAGQATLEAELEAELRELDEQRQAALVAERERIDRIDRLNRELELVTEPVQPPVVGVAVVPAASIAVDGTGAATAVEPVVVASGVVTGDGSGVALPVVESGDAPGTAPARDGGGAEVVEPDASVEETADEPAAVKPAKKAKKK